MKSISISLPSGILSRLGRASRQDNDIDIELGVLNAAGRVVENGQTSKGIVSRPNRLDTLPFELRLQIYVYALVSADKVVWEGQYKTRKWRSHGKSQLYMCNKEHEQDQPTTHQPDRNIFSLLLTCKTIQSEAAAIFYRRNDFVFKCRTPSSRHGLVHSLVHSLFTANLHPNSLESGLPHAFDNKFFKANARHITFACVNARFERLQDHVCGLEGARRDRVGEIVSSCPALRALAIHQPEIEANMEWSTSGFWSRTVGGRWTCILVPVAFVAFIGIMIGVVVIENSHRNIPSATQT